MAIEFQTLKNEHYKGALQNFDKYRQWRTERAMEAVNSLNSTFPVKNKKFLDYGCGYGTLTAVLADKGAEVTPVEVDVKRLHSSKEFLKNTAQPIQIGNAGLPFKDASFDGVVSMDVLEHVQHDKVDSYMSESFRVLKPDGVFYAEITPYYSFAGHHLLQYTPLPIHLFVPQSIIKKIVHGVDRYGFKTVDEIWQQFETLNKIHIDEVRQHISGHDIKQEGYIFKIPGLFKANLPFLGKIGRLGEFFTLSYEFIAKK